jgi:hypothetical protein
MKGNTGSSVSADPKAAGKAKNGLPNVKVAFAYASVAYDLAAILSFKFLPRTGAHKD